VVHVVLRAFLGRLGNRLRCLPLGADEQHPPALGDGLADDVERRVEHRNGLRQVDDVDAVARAVDEFAHAGIPALRLVAEVNASFQQLTQIELGKSHGRFLFRFAPWHGMRSGRFNRWTVGDVSPGGPPMPADLK